MTADLKTVLLGQAEAEIVHAIQQLQDETTPSLPLEAMPSEFVPRLKQDLLDWITLRAREEMVKAEAEVDQERHVHMDRIALFRQHSRALPLSAVLVLLEGAEADEDVSSAVSPVGQMVEAAQEVNVKMMEIVQKLHNLYLKHCFTSHLVTEATAEKLVKLYEVKSE